MKKKMIILALTGCISVGAVAQSAYDAATIADTDLNGTARFVGMGGAMGALGGDISTMGTNPAGIGIYRSNDAMISFGFSSIGTESKLGKGTFNSDKNRWDFNNAGFVISTKIGNQTALRYVNFGFNYQKAKSFYRTTTMGGQLGFSQTDLMSYQANQMLQDGGIDLRVLTQDNINPYDDYAGAGWLGAMGWDTFLVEADDNVNSPFYSLPVEPVVDYRSIERGGIDQYDFNVAFNIKDRVYLGLTIGARDVDYRKSYFYSEDLGGGDSYDLSSENRIEGIGWNAKLGIIFRPIEDSPLRIGLAVHTPTFYSLSYKTAAVMNSNLWFIDTETGEETLRKSSVDTSYELGDEYGNRDMKREFDLRTPWKYNVSLGYTVGSSLALGAEYEYEDFSSMKFYYPEGDEMGFETQQVKQTNKGVHTFRLGAEYRVIPQFAFRLGYNISSAAYKDDAVKVLPYNSINTDTDFANAKSLSNYTLGIGYRGSQFYADLAYKYSTQKADFYPFAFSDERPAVTKITNTRSQVLLTLGLRF